MARSTENITRWIEQADIDFFTHFIKAWIPFNAWYKHHHSSAGLNSDRAIINHLKRNRNTIKNRIEYFIESEGDNCESFRSYVSSLHTALLEAMIENGDQVVRLDSLVIGVNPDNQVNESYNRITYFLHRKDLSNGNIDEIKIIVKGQNGNAKFNYTQQEYSSEDLAQHTNFKKDLNSGQQQMLLQYYKVINPLRPECLLLMEPPANDNLGKPKNYYAVGNHAFVRDLDLISKGLIEVLYVLRNKLFHGEIVPNQNTSKVYENAYFMLRMLLEAIR